MADGPAGPEPARVQEVRVAASTEPARRAGHVLARTVFVLALVALAFVGFKVFQIESKLSELAAPSAGSLAVTGGGISIVDGTVGARSVDGTDFGTVLIGSRAVERVFVLRNEGEQELTLGTVELPAGFTLVEGPEPSFLPPGRAIALVIRLEATDLGAATGAIRIPVAEWSAPFSFGVSGRVVGPPALVVVAQGGVPGVPMREGELALAASGTDFGVVPFEGVATLEFEVRNEGGLPVSLGEVAVPAGFVVVDPLVPELAPGAADMFSIRIDTLVPGRREGEVGFTTGTKPGRFTFSIAGEVLTAFIETVTIPVEDAVFAEFASDGSRLLLWSSDLRTRLLDTVTGATIFNRPESLALSALPGGVRPIRSKERVGLISVRGNAREVVVVDLRSGGQMPPLAGGHDVLLPVAFSPNGFRLVTSTNTANVAHVWDVANGALLQTLEAGRVTVAAFSPDGTRIVTGASDGFARIWDASTYASLSALDHAGEILQDILFSPDGSRIATVSNISPSTTRLWDAATGELVADLGDTGKAIVFSSVGSRLYTAGSALQSWDSVSGAAIATLPTSIVATRLAISSDGRWLASYDVGGDAELWDLQSGTLVQKIAGVSVRAIALAGDAPQLLMITSPSAASRENALRIWERSASGANTGPRPP